MELRDLEQRVARLFPGSSNPHTVRVGLEHELLTIDMATGSSVAPDRIQRITRDRSYAEHVSVEPGGQLELSLPPAERPEVAIARLRTDLAAVRADCLAAGVLLHQAPVDPRVNVPLRLRSPRYLAMQSHFDSIGPAGRTMMRRTASTQVCLDWWPGRAGLEQWRVLHLSAPFLAAAFARCHGTLSRLTTWLAVDPDRTAFDDRLLHGDPVAAYTSFAAGASAFTCEADHLSTLFPAVRPRRTYLEVRYLDAQSEAGLRSVLEVLTALMYDEACRTRALMMLEPELHQLRCRWHSAAAGDADTVALGHQVVALASAGDLAGAA